MTKAQIIEICDRFEKNKDEWMRLLFIITTGTSKRIGKNDDSGYTIDDDFLITYTKDHTSFIAFEEVCEIILVASVDIT